MTIAQVQYVCEIAKRGSMSRAAEQFYISQPALSEQLKALETELRAAPSSPKQGSFSADMPNLR